MIKLPHGKGGMIGTMYPIHYSVLTILLYFLDLLPKILLTHWEKEYAWLSWSSVHLSAVLANSQ